MNTREKGRSLERREARVWREAGWLVEDRHPAKFVGPGRIALCDFFDKYDFMGISRERRAIVLVQVSTESPNSHGHSLGVGEIRYDFQPNKLLELYTMRDVSEYQVFELYVYYRKLKGQGWVADRRWWSSR